MRPKQTGGARELVEILKSQLYWLSLYEFMICNGCKADGCETVENLCSVQNTNACPIGQARELVEIVKSQLELLSMWIYYMQWLQSWLLRICTLFANWRSKRTGGNFQKSTVMVISMNLWYAMATKLTVAKLLRINILPANWTSKGTGGNCSKSAGIAINVNLLYAMAAKLTVENLFSVRKLEKQENWWKYSKVCSQPNWLHVCCSTLQCVALCCSVLKYVAVCCSVLQCIYYPIY